MSDPIVLKKTLNNEWPYSLKENPEQWVTL